MPLNRKAEKAQVRIAKREKRRALIEVKQTEIELLVELENAIQDYKAILSAQVLFEMRFALRRRPCGLKNGVSYQV